MKFFHVAQNGVKVSNHKNEEEGSKGGGPWHIFWGVYLVCMECYQGNKVVSVEG